MISYADGTNDWSLDMRCRALLAGAMCVLDGRKMEFSEELHHVIMDILKYKNSEHEGKKIMINMIQSVGIIGESNVMITIFRQVLKILFIKV